MRVLSIISILTLYLSGCSAPKTDETSQLTWGHLAQVNQGFMAMPPNSSISICGYKAEDAAGYVKRWAAVIGRDQHLKIDGSCNKSATKVVTIQGPGSSQCGQGIAGYTDTIKSIVVCKNFADNVLTHTLMHETGHIWGMCDQYSQGKGCDARSSGKVQPKSIMGAAFGLTDLTEDDKEGIRNLASRTSIPNAQLWKNVDTSPSSTSGESSTAANGEQRDLCKSDPRINQAMKTEYEPLCALFSDPSCIADLPCRYVY